MMLVPLAGLGMSIDKSGVQLTYASKIIGNMSGIPWTIFRTSWIVALMMLIVLGGSCWISYQAGRKSHKRG
jgi:hypothetical protein